MDMICNTTFADLTGCGAQCSFAQSVLAPSSCFPSLVYAGKRVDAETCYPPSTRATLKGPIATVQKYQELLATAAPTVEKQALLTRALFIQSNMGNLNELFTGNGFTATGVGGVIMPTSTEVIISPFNLTLIPPGKGSTRSLSA